MFEKKQEKDKCVNVSENLLSPRHSFLECGEQEYGYNIPGYLKITVIKIGKNIYKEYCKILHNNNNIHITINAVVKQNSHVILKFQMLLYGI